MRNLFQSRPREKVAKPVPTTRPNPEATVMRGFQTHPELDDGISVSELSELEARALCAREGIQFFWPLREAVPAR